MIDNCIEHDATVCSPEDRPAVLVVDPGGNLKLVKWRLKSDGYNILYTGDLAAVEALVVQNDVRIVMLDVLNSGDLTKLKTINRIKGNFEVITFTSDNNIELKKQIFAVGVRRILTKPINYPRLSLVVGEELKKANRERLSKNTPAVNRQGIVPIGLPRIYKTVLDHVKTAVLITDCDGVIVCVNRPMTLLLQMNEGYVLDKPYQKIMDELCGTYQCELLGLLQKVMETVEIQSTREILISNGSESLLPVEAEAHPIFDNKGKFIGTFLAVGEMSGSDRLERVLAQSEKLAMVGQLAAGAVHEIRNPLTSVKGFIQLLQNEVEGSPKAEYFDIIIDEIDRVNTIVSEFLKLAKPTQPNRKPSDLKELWEDIKVLMEGEAFLLNVNIKEDFSDQIKPVLIDREQIKQVLINVVRNSFEAMVGGGDLTVRFYEIERYQEVCLEISDTGPGMDEETTRRIFVPFFTTKESGTGLGLAVSLTIMENHGGRMEVNSKKGNGTTTVIYFPYE